MATGWEITFMGIPATMENKFGTFAWQMKETLRYKIMQLSNKAKESGKKDIKATLSSGDSNSLNKVIKTKQEADTFMKMLKAL